MRDTTTRIARTSARAARRRTRYAADAVAAMSSLLLTGCGDSPLPEMAACGVIGDASSSATELLTRARPAIEKFVAEQRCGSVQVVAITANSVGETCTARALDLTGSVRTHPSNVDAWKAEFQTEQVPRVSTATAKLAECVVQKGTAGGTDVFGALTELDRLADPVPVLLVSDLVNTVGIDLSAVPLASPEQRAQVRAQAEESGLVPSMNGWAVEVVGAAFGTTNIGPERSAQLQLFFEELVEHRGGSWTMHSV